uniref:Uncharacterized protein n=1 Tax=Alexandrium andersonii TaxID=327968 RepID=A0A7S2AGP6_9DINO|mmetsp:Transcript_1183/g.2584  ORF Transcript_1183/g.2584 Transcript_1183/m.2584 type:complete len:111 (+) Transcript_1183:3-335(+)
MLKLAFSFTWTYGLPLGLLVSASLVVWMVCWSSPPTEEERAKRQAFEERLAAAERRLAQRQVGGGSPAAESAGDAAGECGARTASVASGQGEVAPDGVAGEKQEGEKKND